MFIIDTNVISDLRVPSRISPQVLAWSNSMRPASFYISAITVLELERGTQSKERKDQAQGRILREWLDGVVLANYEGRILPIDTAVALRCGGLHVPNPKGFADALIAATALVHSMTVVTRNVKDFAATGCLVMNPWEKS